MFVQDNILKASDRNSVRHILESSGFFYDYETEVALSIFDETFAKGMEESAYYWLLSREDERLAGFAVYGPNPCSNVAWDVYWIAVEESLRGRHLGRGLMETLEADAKRRGAVSLWIETSGRELYLPTRRFYEKAGYSLAGELKDYYAIGDSKIIYSKTL